MDVCSLLIKLDLYNWIVKSILRFCNGIVFMRVFKSDFPKMVLVLVFRHWDYLLQI